MSHLGMKILYSAINARQDAWCERVFSPWVDMAELMRRDGIPLFSLESRTPVKDFDLLGITLQYEMSFTNILEMLSLAGIPLRGADRGEKDPIVVAGGPCAYNPEPLAKFIDAFMIGAGEDTTAGFTGFVDELRVSPGIVAATEFLTPKKSGGILILR